MAQHNECISSNGKTPTQNCWKLPKVLNESGVYTYDYDYGDYDDDNSEYNYDESNYDFEKVIKYEDKYVFVEEAKHFLSTLKSKKAHPIIPRSRLVKIELDNDNKSLKSISDKFAEIDNEEAENTEDQNSLLLKLLECEEDLKDDNDRCYMWMSWGEWTKVSLTSSGAMSKSPWSSNFSIRTTMKLRFYSRQLKFILKIQLISVRVVGWPKELELVMVAKKVA